MTIRRVAAAAAVLWAAVLVWGCDNGPSAVETRPRAEATSDYAAPAAEPRGGGAEAEGLSERRERAQTPRFEGKPLWSSTRRYTAEENARRHFDRNGGDLGARDYDHFLRIVHGFVAEPPAGTLTLKRNNGDTLLYDPKGNRFAVVARDGAPRTMFKPDEGMAYWERQKEIEAERAARRARPRD